MVPVSTILLAWGVAFLSIAIASLKDFLLRSLHDRIDHVAANINEVYRRDRERKM